MADHQPPPPTTQPPPPAADTADKPKRAWKTWHLAAVGVVAFLVGIGAGGAGGEEAAQEEPAASEDTAAAEEIEALEEQVAQLEEQLAERDELLAAAAEESPEEEPEPEPEPAPEPEDDGTFTAGNYSFTDVQVREDGLGDFEVRTRATNNGSDKSAVIVSATMFADGSVVGTADGSVSDWAGGATVTLEMISLDDYVEWDEIEFQIDTEF